MLVSLLALLVVTVPCLAAEGRFTSKGNTYTVRTNTSGGSCVTESVLINGLFGSRVTCSDGDVTAVGNTIFGCEAISMEGLCAKGIPPVGPEGSSQLNCSDGPSYNISDGGSAHGCSNDNDPNADSASCVDAQEPDNFAQASCDDGCGDVGGMGCCCQVGLEGCGEGASCDE